MKKYCDLVFFYSFNYFFIASGSNLLSADVALYFLCLLTSLSISDASAEDLCYWIFDLSEEIADPYFLLFPYS